MSKLNDVSSQTICVLIDDQSPIGGSSVLVLSTTKARERERERGREGNEAAANENDGTAVLDLCCSCLSHSFICANNPAQTLRLPAGANTAAMDAF
jgi:hypothetical protein